MKKKSPRRLFLKYAVLSTASVTLLSSSSVMHALTVEESPFEGYNPYAENKADLRNSLLSEKSVTVKGTVFNSTGNIPVSKATIEVWHLSPNSKKFRHRAKLTSNASGEYQFITDFPNKEYGRMARIYFKISKGDSSYFTDLAMNDLGAHISEKHWAKNQVLGKALYPKQELFFNQANITFNLSI